MQGEPNAGMRLRIHGLIGKTLVVPLQGVLQHTALSQAGGVIAQDLRYHRYLTNLAMMSWRERSPYLDRPGRVSALAILAPDPKHTLCRLAQGIKRLVLPATEHIGHTQSRNHTIL
jgi:hypothetical protein